MQARLMIKCKLSFLDRLNVGPKAYLQTTSPSEKKTKEKSKQKGGGKVIQLVLKDIERYYLIS